LGPVLVFGFAWFLAVAIELGTAGLLSDIARDFKIPTVGVYQQTILLTGREAPETAT
jgi:predicted MFS family arabinose efflux permease